MKNIIKDKRVYWFLLAFLAIPIILNFAYLGWKGFGLSNGNTESWLSFFGSYFGGILGGIVAYVVAKTTVNEQFKSDIKKENILNEINQIPSLYRLKHQLEVIQKRYETVIEALNGIDNLSEEEKERLPSWISFSPDIFNKIRENSLNALEKINEIELEVDILKRFQEYDEVREVLTYNFREKEDKLGLFKNEEFIGENKIEKLNEYKALEKDLYFNKFNYTNMIELIEGGFYQEKLKVTIEELEELIIVLEDKKKMHIDTSK